MKMDIKPALLAKPLPIAGLVVLLMLMAPLSLWAQQADTTVQLLDINRLRLKTNTVGMSVLGGWALTNIGVGLVMQSQTTGSTRAFWQMNAGWNAVNLALAGFGLWGALGSDPAAFSLAETAREGRSVETLLWVNAGLDVGYMMTGVWLMERGRRETLSGGDPAKADRFTGFGQSLLLQGGFLLVFDTVMALLHRGHNNRLFDLLEYVQINPGGVSIRF